MLHVIPLVSIFGIKVIMTRLRCSKLVDEMETKSLKHNEI